ncbi:alpha/beta fold hydrolase [Wenxinia saemankumensis]|uniref:Pimeloyl-ACP methyl ester carboxylesterase n=1 Tax=Wenxinia saemankumensis TaxID=1447782 RepID=A0A1M6GRS2_9RHOB|nr:alpha/beta hydrolase [Wenxinia saemankumensis]SHJ12643.1 Pimeloyl-ACP methyl ester carboxylesterase [Wenxinia saemankumensis]
MPIVTTTDGVDLYVRDWGQGRPVVLIHGWPLNADSWEHQALGLAEAGFRVISYDRRGFGRSGQPWGGYDYDTMSDDLAAVISTLGLSDAAIAGFSMGGGEVARYMSRHEGKGVAQAALISSIAPYMLQTDDHDGVPEDVFAGMKEGLRKDRAAFLQDFFKDFYGQGTGAGGVSEAVLHWTWSMAMMASPKATLDCVDAFGKTDLRDDMGAFDVPTLVIHGTDDQTVPIDSAGRAAAKAVKGATLKEYAGAPHGLTATEPDRVTQDLLDFLRG